MAQHKRTLYISDLDGTLLNDESRLSGHTVQRLNELIAKGMLFSIATARTPATVVDLMQEVKMNIPAILMTGALTYDLATKQYLAISSFPQEVARQLIDMVATGDMFPMIYYIEQSQLYVAYRNPINAQQQAFIAQRTGTPYKKYIEVDEGFTVPEKCVLIFFMGDYDKLEAIYNLISDTAGHHSYLYYDNLQPTQGYLEIYPSGTTKAGAIQQLAQRIGVDEVVVFGDNVNDMSMFEIAQRSYAVENAVESLKERATDIIASNTHDGVVQFLFHDFKG